MLKYTSRKTIDLHDWDTLVKQTYGRSYSFQQQDGCKNRGTHHITIPSADTYDFENDTVPEIVNHEEMGVSFKAWLERDPSRELNGKGDDKHYEANKIETEKWIINLWWERNFYPDVQMVANDLHEKGLVEAGDYVIDIDW